MRTFVAALVTAFLLAVVMLQIAGQAMRRDRQDACLLCPCPKLSNVFAVDQGDADALTAWYGAEVKEVTAG